MKLIYITSKKFPSKKADPFYVRKMAEAFSKLLGSDFLFLVRGGVPNEFKHMNTASINAPKRFKTIFYFLYLPILIFLRKWGKREITFLSYDPYLLSVLIFWRKIFRFKYKVASDWHQLFDDFKDKYIASNSDYLTCTSKRLRGLLTSVCGIDENKILATYGGVDTSVFVEKSKIKKEDLKKKLGLSSDSFLVGYVGGFRAVGLEKGLDTMIKAIPYLDKNIKVVLVGGLKKEIDEYTALARKIGVEDRCLFVGRQKGIEKVIEYELAMDTLVIPYPDKHHFRDYGFPMKVWEYMASGRPIIYSNLEIMSEVLEGRATSFKPDNAKSFADAVLSVYRNTDKAEEISMKNITDVETYSWKARAQNIINFISK